MLGLLPISNTSYCVSQDQSRGLGPLSSRKPHTQPPNRCLTRYKVGYPLPPRILIWPHTPRLLTSQTVVKSSVLRHLEGFLSAYRCGWKKDLVFGT